MEIFVIGSISRSDKIEMVANYYKMLGHDVDYVKRNPDESFERLVEDCFSRINVADKIVVVRKEDGSIGEGTTYEMTFARFLGKKVEIWRDPYPIDQVIKE